MTKIEQKTQTTWRKVKLREVADVLNGYAFSSRAFVPKNGDAIPVFKMGNIKEGGGIQWTGKEDYIPENQALGSVRFLTEPEDILMCMTDMKANVRLLGYSAFIKNEKFLVNQRVGRIKAKKNLAQARFLFYYLNSPNYISYIRSTARSGVQVNLTTEEIRGSPLLIPDITDQKRIADILSSFDDKIELNNKISKNLEQAAQAIFKEWFVNFRFPGHEKVKLVDSELGKIPEGWEFVSVEQLVKRLPQGKTYRPEELKQKGSVPIYNQSSGIILGYHDGEPAFSATIDEPVIVFGDHTCRMKLIIHPCSLGPNVVPFIGKSYPAAFIYYLTKEGIVQHEYKRHWTEFEQQEFIVPPAELAVEFVSYVKPLVQKIVEIESENQKLAALRDLLLPKLMSGEIKV